MHFLPSFFLLFSGYLLVAFFPSLPPPPPLLCPICAFAGTASTVYYRSYRKGSHFDHQQQEAARS